MPQITKFFFYAFIIFQILLLNVTFINSAVIRREQRSIITNGTVPASAELEPVTSIELEDDGNLLLEMPSFKDDTTTKNSIQDTAIITTSSIFDEKKKEDTTLTGLRLNENSVGLSSDSDRKSSKVVMIEEDDNKNVSEKNKNEESTTVEMMMDRSTITKIEQTTTITPIVIKNDNSTSNKEEEEGVSTVSIASHETSTSKKEEVSTASHETSTSKKEEVSSISKSSFETSTSKNEEVSTVSPKTSISKNEEVSSSPLETSTSEKEEVNTISAPLFETSTSKNEVSTVFPETSISKKEEVSTASLENSTFKNEETVISTVSTENSTSKKDDEEVSTHSIEDSTQLKDESLDHTNDKTKKKEKSIFENSVDTSEDTTQVKSKSFEETTNGSATNTNLGINETTTVPPFTTIIPVENDSAPKTTHSPSLTTDHKLEKIDNVTLKLNVQNELIETSTELANNDISKKLFVTNEHKANMIDEKELVTTESILLAKEQKMTDVKFTKPVVDETTQIPLTSTEEFFDEQVITFKTVDEEDFKKPASDVKNSNSSSTEKRGKFIANNYSSFNDFHLPNTSDVWALASLRSVGKSKSSELQNSVETSEEKPLVNNSMATKSLHDWTRVMDTTNNNMESKPFMRIVENTEDPSTEIATSVTMTTQRGTESNTTVKTIDITTDITTEIPIQQETTETSLNQDNEVELLTTKVETEPTTVIAVTLKDKFERETTDDNPTESQSTNKDFETTETEMPVKKTTDDENPPKTTDEIISTTTVSLLDVLTNHEKTIDENKVDGNSFEKETTSLPITTTRTTQTPMPQIVTVKSETTESLANGEITRETNAGTTSLSTSSLSDFTTSIPFLTSTTAITKTTMSVMTDVMTTSTPPVVILNTDDDKVIEPPSSSSTIPSKIPTHTTSPVAVTIHSSATTTPLTTTTTTTIMPPAVTVIEEIIETQTTEPAPHTPAIISNETMIQKSNNNYNEYEVVSKSTENYTDYSSTEAIEATTRVGLQSNWSTNAAAAEIPTTTEVDKLDEEDLDVTTVSNFENNNAYDIESTFTTTSSVIGTVTLAPKTHPIVTDTVTEDTKTTSIENLDHIDPIHKISETAEASIESNVIDPLQVGETSTAAAATTTTTTPPTTTTTENNQENMKMPSTTTTTAESGDDESIYSILTTTTPRIISTSSTTSTPNYYDESAATTFESISTKKEDVYSIVPTMTIDNGGGGYHVPKSVLDDTTTLMPPGDLGVGVGGGGLPPMDSPEAQETDVNVIIAISVSTVGIIALILLVAFLYVMRKRQKQMSYGQRCRPVSLDAYSLDNVSVYNSVRRKGATLRASKRSYGNVAFDDPSLRHNVLGTHELARYVEKKSSIWEEFKEVPQIIARADEVPAGCEDKNRYANVIPLPETRVILQQQNGDEKSEYINANYVRGPKDTTNYYIACQAPLETTVNDFWRMIWEQNSRVIIMATDLIENGIDKCAEYLPPSVTLDNHTVFGDYQVTLKHREVKEKYAISTLMLKNTVNDESREITHYWYRWPETGVPTDEAAIIAMLLEARSSLKAYTIEQCDGKIENSAVEDNSSAKIEINGNVTSEKSKPQTKDQGPLTIHCSPGTGRTGTILACDIAMRCLEEPKRTVDIPQTVYSVRRGRASAVQTKEQYEFIYKVTHMYATKISNINNDN